jgi:hypothetical protein
VPRLRQTLVPFVGHVVRLLGSPPALEDVPLLTAGLEFLCHVVWEGVGPEGRPLDGASGVGASDWNAASAASGCANAALQGWGTVLDARPAPLRRRSEVNPCGRGCWCVCVRLPEFGREARRLAPVCTKRGSTAHVLCCLITVLYALWK